MAIERTLSIIKPDAVAKNVIGQIVLPLRGRRPQDRRRQAWRTCRAAKPSGSTPSTSERPFFKDLVEFMISGPVMIQVLEGENAIAKNRDLMGATDPEEGSRRHHPRRLRRQHRRQRRARLRRRRNRRSRSRVLLRRPRTSTPEVSQLDAMTTANLLELRSRGAGRVLRTSWARSASARRSCSAGSTSAARSDFDQMTDLAKSLREKLATSAARRGAAGRSRSTNPADGTIKWLFDVGDGNAVEAVFIPEDDRGTLSRRRRPAARSDAASARPATRASAATSPPARSSAQLWFAEHFLRKHLRRRDERVISNVVMMGMGEPLQNYRHWCRPCALMLDDNALRPVAPPRHGVDLRRGAA